jgi:hypothetical protein
MRGVEDVSLLASRTSGYWYVLIVLVHWRVFHGL